MTVQGTIGNDNVFLDNAATESTLRALLKSSLGSQEAIKQMAIKLGINTEKLQNAIDAATKSLDENNKEIEESTKKRREQADAEAKAAKEDADRKKIEAEAERERISRMIKFNDGLRQVGAVMGVFAEGTASASGLMGSLISNMQPGVIKTFMEGFQKLIILQEQNFQSYQVLTNSGITFAGALTDIRVAASQSYMTLNEFTEMYKNNSQVFMKLGGNVEQGAESFAKLSSTMMKTDLGLQLQAMGYSYTQINQSMLDYLDITGGVNSSELKNQKVVDQLAKSSANYMMELDLLSRITGKSREEISNNLKKQMEDASYQSALMGMEDTEREKHVKAMAYVTATGIKGAEDYYKSLVLGLPPMTEAGRKFAAIMPEAANELRNMVNLAKDGTAGNKEMRQSFFQLNESLINGSKTMSDQTKAALIQQGSAIGASIQDMQKYVNTLEQGGKTQEQRQKLFNDLVDRMERADNQAKNIAAFNESLKKLSEMFNRIFAPAIETVGAALGFLAIPIGAFADTMIFLMDNIGFFDEAISAATIAIGGFIIALAAIKTVKAGQGVIDGIGGMLGGGDKGAAKGKGGGIIDRIGGMFGGAKDKDKDDDVKVKGNVTGDLGGGSLKSLGRGIVSLAKSLEKLAGPLGVKAVGGAGIIGLIIITITAAIGAAAWIMGKALPTLAEGLSSFAEIDGENLTKVGLGVVALGAGLATMAVGTVWSSVGNVIGGLVDKFGDLIGVQSPMEKLKEFASLGPTLGEAGRGITEFTSGLDQILNFDYDQLSKGAAALKELNAAVKSLSSGSVTNFLSQQFGKMIGTEGPADIIDKYIELSPKMQEAAGGINDFTSAMKQLTELDFQGLASGAESMKQIKNNIPSRAQVQRLSGSKGSARSLESGLTGMSRDIGLPPLTSAERAAAATGQTATSGAGSQELMIAELKLFNANAQELITQIKVVGDYQKRTYDKIKISGSMWP